MTTRELIISNAKAYNNRLSDLFLNRLKNVELLSFCHPDDRIDFNIKLKEEDNNV
jgi:hypothetical protein